MKILVLNCGSSSVKYQVFDMENKSVPAKGIVEEIGSDKAIVKYNPSQGEKSKTVEPIKNHEEALNLIIRTLMDPLKGVVKDESELLGVGHRVVHGGEKFSGSVLITEEVIREMEECIEFAPLHNPANLAGIAAARAVLNVPQVGVFDTAFHQSMPETAYLYAIPYEDYTDFGVRRYGFHGTSHYYVSREAAKMIGKPVEELKIVTCHLGNGASVAAVKEGKSVDTSMGFTPLEGLIMGTRSGDLDPFIPLYLMDKRGLSAAEMSDYLNKKSGIKGISGVGSDMREIELRWEHQTHDKAALAFEMFFYRVRKYIGSYCFAMGGADAIVFTGGIGERSPLGRKLALENLEQFGIEINDEENDKNAAFIGSGTIKVMVVPTDEELVIAEAVADIVSR